MGAGGSGGGERQENNGGGVGAVSSCVGGRREDTAGCMSGERWADLVDAEADPDAEAGPAVERKRGSRGGEQARLKRAERAAQREARAAATGSVPREGGRAAAGGRVSGDRVGRPLGVGAMGDRAVRSGAAPQHGGFPQLNDVCIYGNGSTGGLFLHRPQPRRPHLGP